MSVNMIAASRRISRSTSLDGIGSRTDQLEVAVNLLESFATFRRIPASTFANHDKPDVTVRQFMKGYHVDQAQALRVEKLALALCDQAAAVFSDVASARRILSWAARLHEVGVTIAHAGYHKHSAYILANADAPGFSKVDQAGLSNLVRAHRGSLAKATRDLKLTQEDWELIAILRLASLLCRARRDIDASAIRFVRIKNRMRLTLPSTWLTENPLTETLLEDEIGQWKSVGGELEVWYGEKTA